MQHQIDAMVVFHLCQILQIDKIKGENFEIFFVKCMIKNPNLFHKLSQKQEFEKKGVDFKRSNFQSK